MRLPEDDYEDRGVGHVPRLFTWLADRIAYFAPAEGPPPNKLWPFLRWSLIPATP